MTKEKYLEKLQQLPQFRGCVASRNQARQLPTGLNINDIFWIENEEKAQIVVDKGKKELVFTDLDMNATVSAGFTIYEMNKNIVSKEPLFDFGDIEKLDMTEKMVNDWLKIHQDEYFLLYGRYIHYFTLFKRTSGMTGIVPILETVAEIGDLISIDISEGALEIWVRTENDPAILLYLLPYDAGLVEI